MAANSMAANVSVIDVVIGAALGAGTGIVYYLWDWWKRGDKANHFYGDIFWAPGLWSILIPITFLFLWTFGIVSGEWVLVSAIGWVASMVATWLFDFVWSPVAGLLGIVTSAVDEAAGDGT